MRPSIAAQDSCAGILPCGFAPHLAEGLAGSASSVQVQLPLACKRSLAPEAPPSLRHVIAGQGASRMKNIRRQKLRLRCCLKPGVQSLVHLRAVHQLVAD